jgi:hypothetical protein
VADPAVTAIVDRMADPASVAWAHEGQGNLAALPNPLAAIAAAAALGNTRALQSVTAPKDLRKAASAALHRLKSAGVKVDTAPPPRAFTLGKETFELPSRAFLGLPEADGDIELLLTASDEHGSCALGMILGGGGVREMRHAHMGRGDLRDIWRKSEQRAELVEVPFAVGLHYADRFAASSGHAHDYHHFLTHVPKATLAQAKALDPVAQARAPIDEAASELPRWVAPSSVLGADAVREGAARLLTVGKEDMETTERDAAMNELFAEVADRAFADGDLQAFLRAADLAADSYTLHGRPQAADSVRAQAAAARAGARGRDLDGVRLSSQLAVLMTFQRDTEAQIQAINDQMRQMSEGAED